MDNIAGTKSGLTWAVHLSVLFLVIFIVQVNGRFDVGVQSGPQHCSQNPACGPAQMSRLCSRCVLGVEVRP